MCRSQSPAALPQAMVWYVKNLKKNLKNTLGIIVSVRKALRSTCNCEALRYCHAAFGASFPPNLICVFDFAHAYFSKLENEIIERVTAFCVWIYVGPRCLIIYYEMTIVLHVYANTGSCRAQQPQFSNKLDSMCAWNWQISAPSHSPQLHLQKHGGPKDTNPWHQLSVSDCQGFQPNVLLSCCTSLVWWFRTLQIVYQHVWPIWCCNKKCSWKCTDFFKESIRIVCTRCSYRSIQQRSKLPTR